MSESFDKLRALISSYEPPDIRNYLSVPQTHTWYATGSTTPSVGGFIQLPNGIWIPRVARIERDSMDFARTYITWSEVTGGVKFRLPALEQALRRVPLADALTATTATMAALRDVGAEEPMNNLDQSSLRFFKDPWRTRLSVKLREGSTIHAPQLVMILSKLAMAYCPDDVESDSAFTAPLPYLLMIIADCIDNSDDVDSQQLTLELAANINFNAPYREDSELALYQRRWIELPREDPIDKLSGTLSELFQTTTGVPLSDQTTVALAIWARCMLYKTGVMELSSLQGRGWDIARVSRAVSLVSRPLDEFRNLIRDEVRDHGLDWYFTTFTRFPIVLNDNTIFVLDPKLLLRRCFGLLPRFDIEAGLRAQGRGREIPAVRAALTYYSERAACEVFESLAGTSSVRRVYSDSDLKRAFPRLKVADVAIDYGDSWVVVEVTTSEAARDTVNAARIEGLEQDLETIIREIEQVSATISHLQRDESKLTGTSRVNRLMFYPMVVLTEGFPNNFVTTNLIREEARNRGLLVGPNVAPVELVSISELDILEGAVESSGPTLPEILRRKHASNLSADSLRNFLVGNPDFDAKRPERVRHAFARAFGDATVGLGGARTPPNEEG